jgi:hypothetical protein
MVGRLVNGRRSSDSGKVYPSPFFLISFLKNKLFQRLIENFRQQLMIVKYIDSLDTTVLCPPTVDNAPK